MNHRYPTRALTINSGEQLLQKRTRSTLQKPEGKSSVPNDSHQSSPKKPRTKDQDSLETAQHYPLAYAEQMDPIAQDKYQRALSSKTKANPRMMNAQMMNPHQMWPQGQFMTPQMMNMSPYAIQMPMMPPMQHIPSPFQTMPNPQGYTQQPDHFQAQIADLNMKIFSLQQQQMAQMQTYSQQFQSPMMQMAQPQMYPQGMMPQQVPIDLESDDAGVKSTKRSKSPSARQSPAKRQSQSPETKTQVKASSAKSKKGQLSNSQKKTEPAPYQVKNSRSVKIQEKAKIAPKSNAGKKSPVKFEGNRTPTRIQKSSVEKLSSNKSSPSKSKFSSIASVREDDNLPVKRSTRIQQKTNFEKKVAQKQAAKKQGTGTPNKNPEVLPQRTLRSSHSNKPEVSKKVKRVSPVRVSPRKTVAKHTRSNYQHLDTTPVKTRLRSRMAPKQSPTKAMSESAAVEKSNIQSTQEQSNILKSLQKEINTSKEQKPPSKQAKSRSRSSEKKKEAPRPPTQDEIMLFGESAFQNQPLEKDSMAQNPLVNQSKKKFEAQTEIVGGKSIEGFENEQVFTDEEEDLEMRAQLEKEKAFLQKRQLIDKLEKELIPEERYKDVSLLFGMPEQQVIELAEEKKARLQKVKDEQNLFGEEATENPAVVKEFSQTKPLSGNEPQVVKEEEPAPQNKSDENLLFGEQPIQQKEEAQVHQIVESQVSEKVFEKLAQKDNVDEDFLFGSEQKQTVLSNVQEETPQDNSDSFNIKVQQNSLQDSKPVSTDMLEQQISTQKSEYLKKQEELDRQIAEIKRQIEAQQKKANLIENDIVQSQSVSQHVPETAANEDQEMIEDSEQVEEKQPFAENEDKEMEDVEDIDQDEVQQALQDSNDVIEEQPPVHKHCVETLKLTEKLKLLYDFQNSIDVAMNMILIKNQTPTFTNLKNIIQLQTKRQFNMSHFQQLIKLEPGFFNHRWESKMGRMELVITHPANVDVIASAKWKSGEIVEPSVQVFQGRISSFTINMRQKIIKQDLIKHMAFELERNYADSNFDPYKDKQWPAFFNFDDVEDIELGQLKDQPRAVQKTSIKDFLKESDNRVNAARVMEVANQKPQQQASPQILAPIPQKQDNDISQLSPSSSECSERDSSEEARKRSNNYNVKTGITQSTLDAIQLKQKLEQEQKQTQQIIVEKQHTQMKIEQLTKVAEQIKSIFDMQAGSTLFLSKLLDKMLINVQSGTFVSKESLRDQIIELTKACPKWIQLVNNLQGVLIKVHQNMNLASYTLKQNIKDYLINKQNGIQQPVPQKANKSLPPPQKGATSQGIQIYHMPQQGFQPYPKQQPGSHSQDQRSALQKSAQISNLSSSNDLNHQMRSRQNSNAGPQLQNQNTNHTMRHTSNYNQYMQQQQQQMNQNKIINNTNHQQQNTQAVNNSVGISSSSGTFLSGPAAHDGGEASLGHDQHMPSKYLSPSLKQSHCANKTSGYGGIGIQFGNDMYQGMQSNTQSRVSSHHGQRHYQDNQHYMDNQQQNYYRQQHKY